MPNEINVHPNIVRANQLYEAVTKRGYRPTPAEMEILYNAYPQSFHRPPVAAKIDIPYCSTCEGKEWAKANLLHAANLLYGGDRSISPEAARREAKNIINKVCGRGFSNNCVGIQMLIDDSIANNGYATKRIPGGVVQF